MEEINTNLTEDNIVAEKPDYVSEVVDIIRSNDSPKIMLNKLEDYHENDIAQVIPTLNVSERKSSIAFAIFLCLRLYLST
jgi:magnesium transporter